MDEWFELLEKQKVAGKMNSKPIETREVGVSTIQQSELTTFAEIPL